MNPARLKLSDEAELRLDVAARSAGRPEARPGASLARNALAVVLPDRERERRREVAVAQLLGHTSAEFSMRVYARDARSEETMVADVLERAAVAKIGS